jgi:hypothetical protein
VEKIVSIVTYCVDSRIRQFIINKQCSCRKERNVLKIAMTHYRGPAAAEMKRRS